MIVPVTLMIVCSHAFGETTKFSDSVILTCQSGDRPSQYHYHAQGPGWPMPVQPECCAVDAESRVYIAQCRGPFGIRVLIFSEEGHHIVTLEVEALVSSVVDMAVQNKTAPIVIMAVHFGLYGEYVMCMNSRELTVTIVGSRGVLGKDELKQSVSADNEALFREIERIRLDGSRLDIIHREEGKVFMNSFDIEAGKMTVVNAPEPEWHQAAEQKLHQKRQILHDAGVGGIMDFRQGPGGRFYYMLIDTDILEVHKVTFEKESSSDERR